MSETYPEPLQSFSEFNPQQLFPTRVQVDLHCNIDLCLKRNQDNLAKVQKESTAAPSKFLS